MLIMKSISYLGADLDGGGALAIPAFDADGSVPVGSGPSG